MRDAPVDTRTAQGKKRKVFYYLNIERALEAVFSDEAIEIVDESRTVRENFGHDIKRDPSTGVKLDLSTAEGEYAAMRFPENRVFDRNDWFNGWMAHWKYDQEKIKLFQKFGKVFLIRASCKTAVRADFFGGVLESY